MNHSLYKITALLLFLALVSSGTFAQSCNAWELLDGDLSLDDNFWDPDMDGNLCMVCADPTGGNEGLDFNPLNASISGWVELGGSDPSGDIQGGGNCGNSDIVEDSDGGGYAYYNIIDPDAKPDNGNERLVFALRIADLVNGNFGLSFLLNADGDCGSDPNGTCGNPCYEYEIQLNTNTQEVFAYDVDGCFGCNSTSLCSGGACNNNALQICVENSSCGTNGNSTFWFFYIDIAQLGGTVPVSSAAGLSIIPVTATSSNGVINKGSNISDYGGIDHTTPGSCPGCTPPGDCTSTADSTDYCALLCAADSTAGVNLPIVLEQFEAFNKGDYALLEWIVATQTNNDRFEIQRSLDGRQFFTIGTVKGAGSSTVRTSYQYQDLNPQSGNNYYRIKQVDTDGKFAYSNLVSLQFERHTNILIQPTIFNQTLQVSYDPMTASNFEVFIFDANGRVVHQIRHPNMEGFQTRTLHLGDLSRGVYFLSIRTNNQVHHQKIIKM